MVSTAQVEKEPVRGFAGAAAQREKEATERSAAVTAAQQEKNAAERSAAGAAGQRDQGASRRTPTTQRNVASGRHGRCWVSEKEGELRAPCLRELRMLNGEKEGELCAPWLRELRTHARNRWAPSWQ